MDRKIIVTGDNSKTLLISELNETYHSTNGAYNEAVHVFINAGIKYFPNKTDIKIFEMGFGTGLNALLSVDYALNNNVTITYMSIEKYPLSKDLVNRLDYPTLLSHNTNKTLFNVLHEAEWDKPIAINENFTLTKIECALQDAPEMPPIFDLVYYDAFGPRVQPDLWTEKSLSIMFNLLVPGGILVTYCAQGQFKRNLKSIGFEVENLPGPPGKREMTRAIKPKAARQN